MGQYYDTGPYTLAQWNKLIQYANSVLQNPPANTTCAPSSTILSAAGENHIWTAEDITTVCLALERAGCGGQSFSAWRKGDRWQPAMIDEIVAALSNFWKCCQPTPTPPAPTGCCVYVWTAEINRYIVPSNPEIAPYWSQITGMSGYTGYGGTQAQAQAQMDAWTAAEIAFLQSIGYNGQLQAFPPTVTTFNSNGSPATIAGQFIICNEPC